MPTTFASRSMNALLAGSLAFCLAAGPAFAQNGPARHNCKPGQRCDQPWQKGEDQSRQDAQWLPRHNQEQRQHDQWGDWGRDRHDRHWPERGEYQQARNQHQTWPRFPGKSAEEDMPAQGGHPETRPHERDGRSFPQLTWQQRSHLPRLPKGQSYRREGKQVVRVDDRTGEIIAIIGLFAAIAAIASNK